MKIIKIGSNAQSRVAQACDRCRSKKIRCDGVTPCCTQCANVGFECKTSDKLSRRAFPRGYTESLEERVRALEAEVRELKDLLDEKDDKIDLLSKFHNFGSRRTSAASEEVKNVKIVQSLKATPEVEEDSFNITQPKKLSQRQHGADVYFVGASSSNAFVGESIETRT